MYATLNLLDKIKHMESQLLISIISISFYLYNRFNVYPVFPDVIYPSHSKRDGLFLLGKRTGQGYQQWAVRFHQFEPARKSDSAIGVKGRATV